MRGSISKKFIRPLKTNPKLEVIASSGSKFLFPPVVVAIELAGASIKPYSEDVTPVLEHSDRDLSGLDPEQGSELSATYFA